MSEKTFASAFLMVIFLAALTAFGPLRKTWSMLIRYSQNTCSTFGFSSFIIGMSFTSNLSKASAHLSPKHPLARVFQACIGSRPEFSPFSAGKGVHHVTRGTAGLIQISPAARYISLNSAPH